MSDGEQIREELERIPLPPGGAERASAATRAALAERPRRRRRRLIGAGVLAAAVGMLLTSPGQAGVEWVREVVNLKGSEESAPARTGSTIGVGTTPEGDTYEVTAFTNRDERCVRLSIPSGVDDGRAAPSPGYCEYQKSLVGTIGRVNYVRRARGDTAAFGVVAPEVERLELDYSVGGEQVSAEADLYTLGGTFTDSSGKTTPLPDARFFVVFLPEDVGNLEQGSVVAATAVNAEGSQIADAELAWVSVDLGSRGRSDLLPCGSQPFWKDVCADAVSGELRRVSKELVRPLPEALTGALADEGYELTEADVEDRATAGSARLEISRVFAKRYFSGHDGFHYERLVRVSGGGFENELVYLLHYFDVSSHKGIHGGSTEATGFGPAPGPLAPEATTYLLDIEDGSELRAIPLG